MQTPGNNSPLIPLFEGKASSVYLVPAAAGSPPTALIRWHQPPFTSEEGSRAFAENARALAQKHGLTLLDHAIENASPYLVVGYQAEQQGELRRFVDDIEAQSNTDATTVAAPPPGDEPTVITKAGAEQDLDAAPTVIAKEGNAQPLEDTPTVVVQESAAQTPVPPGPTPVPPAPAEQFAPYQPVPSPYAPANQVSAFSSSPSLPPVTPYNEPTVRSAEESQALLWGQATSPTPPPPTGYPGAFTPGPGGFYPGAPIPLRAPKPKKPMSRRTKIAALVAAVVILLAGAITGYIFLPVASAQVEITPQTHHLNKSYEVYSSSVVASDNHAASVKTRSLSVTTDSTTYTAAATGKGQKGGAKAQGKIVFSNVTITNDSAREAARHYISASGRTFVTDSLALSDAPGWSATVNATDENNGAAGNIPAHTIDGMYTISDLLTGAQIGSAYLSNPDPFTGGADDHEYTYASSDDINNANNALQKQLEDTGKQKIQQQLTKENVQIGDITCSYDEDGANSTQSGDEVSQVKIVGTTTCSVEVVNMQDVQKAARDFEGQEITRQYGKGYTAMSQTKMSEPQEISATVGKAFKVTVDGWWAYTVDKNQLARSLASKTQGQASDILHGNTGIKDFHVSVNGLGGSMPSSADKIKIVTRTPTI